MTVLMQLNASSVLENIIFTVFLEWVKLSALNKFKQTSKLPLYE